MIYLIYSLFKGAPTPANQWGAKGLEWTTTSPPPTFNFDAPVVVTEPAYNYRPAEEVPVG
jgi:cytochrome c oxidase subunit 1